VTEVKLGKYDLFYYFSRGMFRLLPPPLFLTFRHSITVIAFTASAPKFVNQLLGGFSNVFRRYIPGSRFVGKAALSDIGKDFATSTQRLARQCFGPAPQNWTEPTEDTAEKIAYTVSTLKAE